MEKFVELFSIVDIETLLEIRGLLDETIKNRKTTPKQQCNGILVDGSRQCQITFDLVDGHCKYHQSQNPEIIKCLGTTKANEPCKNAKGLDNDGYCMYHRTQKVKPVEQQKQMIVDTKMIKHLYSMIQKQQSV